jgi:hypothetical protein
MPAVSTDQDQVEDVVDRVAGVDLADLRSDGEDAYQSPSTHLPAYGT